MNINRMDRHLKIVCSLSSSSSSSSPLSDSLNQQSLSACGENEFDITSNITPAMRQSVENVIPNVASPAFDGTQLSSTKLGNHIKLE
ncbi:hypothetical protein P8452_09845 [Trifolium repens]|nr:hypothetical protein P8452_09845 [Trifolium repens]